MEGNNGACRQQSSISSFKVVYFNIRAMIFYNTNGLPSDKPKEDKFWITKGPSDFVLKENDLTSDIENKDLSKIYSCRK